jgi:hypothetical protein
MSTKWIRSSLSLLALALIFGGSAHAAQTGTPQKAGAGKKAAAAHEMSSTGVITEMDATHLTITQKVAGKDSPMTVVLTPETKKDATLEVGSKVRVKFHKENNDQVASSVRAQMATAKAKTPGTKAKKS